jgi:hypothetical protein
VWAYLWCLTITRRQATKKAERVSMAPKPGVVVGGTVVGITVPGVVAGDSVPTVAGVSVVTIVAGMVGGGVVVVVAGFVVGVGVMSGLVLWRRNCTGTVTVFPSCL